MTLVGLESLSQIIVYCVSSIGDEFASYPEHFLMAIRATYWSDEWK